MMEEVVKSKGQTPNSYVEGDLSALIFQYYSSNNDRPIISTRFVFFNSSNDLTPIPNIVIFNSSSICSIVVTTDSADSVAAWSNERAKPITSAPIVIAFAASSPVFIPPLATIGTSLKRLLTETMQSFVGNPQLLNASAAAFLSGSCERNFSTWLHDVPPAPATSIQAIPTPYSFSATVPAIPNPTSLTPPGAD